jgi:hypothetical protein
MPSLTTFGLLLAAFAECATAAVPRPPCAALPGIVPAVAESMCSDVVVPENGAGVAVRSYGAPSNEVLVTVMTPPNFPYGEVLNNSASNIFYYLEIANSEGKNFLADRTVPITVRPPGADGWLVSMMVSTAAFPDAAKVPTPNNFEMHLESMGPRLMAAYAFNTTALPTEAEFDAACAKVRMSKPKQYKIKEGLWTPTYVLYSAQRATLWTNECWLEVAAA